ncbi:MAG: zinc-finger domain-containing protein [Burkholderiaceae bacterium]|nr:zinc-finger domain-containing protein [Burkholderiaceae bacterium]
MTTRSAQTSTQTTAPVVELDAHDLTPGGQAWCPHPKAGMSAWNSHPRVFLNLSSGQAQCPYCGTVYRLKTVPAVHSV